MQGMAALCTLVALLLGTPILSEESRAFFWYLIEVPFLVAVIFALHFRVREATEKADRRFWNLLTWGFAGWLASLVIQMVYGGPDFAPDLLTNVPYLLFYGATAAALEVQPHVRAQPMPRRLRALDQIGSSVVLFGLLLYFVVLPGLVRQDAFWTSSLALFVALDAYIILRLAALRRVAVDAEWRSIYSWLLLGVTVWSLGDAGVLLMWQEILVDPWFGGALDVVWPLALTSIVVATRTGRYETKSLRTTESRERLGMGPLVVYAVAPPLVHLTLYRFAAPDLDVEPARELLVLGFAGMLAALTFASHTLQSAENRRLVKEESQTKDKLAHQAFHDELTGLPNRNMFRDRLRLAIADARRYKRQCAVLFCDLDRFKVVNDSLGHEAGDQVLVSTAERLQSTVRVLDTVARFGGDEFAIILYGIHGALDAARLAEKMLVALGEPQLIQGKKYVLTTSIGIAVFPEDGEDEAALLKHSDIAMYQAKEQGRNGYRLFTEAMNTAADERLAIEQGLRTAREDGSLVVYYQPIVDIATRQPIGYEALLRWNHPERGFIEPASFIEVAEQTGLIVPIGAWVLETACAWAVQLDSTSTGAPSIAVNMSLMQLREPGLVTDVRTVLERTGLEPARLHLEITESMALAMDSTARVLEELHDLGVQLAVDDFGTGFSALSRLKDLPMDMVKIDRSFVRGLETDPVGKTIVGAIVTMARALGFYVVAEGVETEQEFEAVRRLGCDAAQGFYLSAPMPPDEIKSAMARLFPRERSGHG